MANPIVSDQIAKKGVTAPLIQELEKVVETLKVIQKESKEVGDELKKSLGKKNITDVKSLREAQRELKRLNEELNRSKKIQSDLEKATRAKVKAEQADAVEIARIREQTRLLRRDSRTLGREQLGLNRLYERQTATVNRLTNEYRQAALRYGENSREARRLLNQLRPLEQQIRRIDENTGRFQRNVGNYSKAFGALTSIVAAAGVTLGAAGIFRLLSNGVKVIREFEDANAELAGVLDKTKSEIIALTADSQRLGSTTAFTASEVAKLQIEYARLGFAPKQIEQITESTLDLATAMNSDLGESAELVGSTIRAFGLDTKQAGDVVDSLVKSTTISALSFQRLRTALPKVAAAARATNVSFEETTALLGILVNNGIDAETAGTGLRNIFLEIQKRGISLTDALDMINNSTDKSTKSLELFDKRGSILGLTLADNIDKIDEFAKSIDDADGAAERLATKRLDTLTGKLDLLTSAWEGFILGLEGDGAISGFLKESIELVTQFVDKLNQLNKSDGTILDEATNKRVKEQVSEINKEVTELSKSLSKQNGITTQEARQSVLEDAIAEQEDLLEFTEKRADKVKEENKELLESNKLIGATVKELKDFSESQDSFFISKDQAEARNVTADIAIKVALVNKEQAVLNSLYEEYAELTNQVSDTVTKTTEEEDKRITRLKQLRALLKDNATLREQLLNSEDDADTKRFINLENIAIEYIKEIGILESILAIKKESIDFDKIRIENLNREIEQNSEISKQKEVQIRLNRGLSSISRTEIELLKNQEELIKNNINARVLAGEKANDLVLKLLNVQKQISTEEEKINARRRKERELEIRGNSEILLTQKEINLALLKSDRQQILEDIEVRKKAGEDFIDLRLKLFNKNEEIAKLEEKGRDKQLEEQKRRHKENVRAAERAAQELIKIETRRISNEIKMNEDQIDSSRERERELLQERAAGNVQASESAALERQRQLELQQDNNNLLRQQRDLERSIAFFKLISYNIDRAVSNRDYSGNPTADASSQVSQLPTFFKGTEEITDQNAPTKLRGYAVDAHVARLNKGERVLTTDQNKPLLKMGVKNSEIPSIVEAYKNDMMKPVSSQQIIQQNNFDTSALERKMDKLINKPVQSISRNAITGVVQEEIRRGKRKTVRRYE